MSKIIESNPSPSNRSVLATDHTLLIGSICFLFEVNSLLYAYSFTFMRAYGYALF